MARSSGNVYWPTTRIRRRGKTGHVNIHKRKMLKKVFLFAMLILLLGLFSVWSRIAIVETGYRIHQQTKINRQIKAESDALKLEISTLRSPRRLEQIAEKKLKLYKPFEKQVIFIK